MMVSIGGPKPELNRSVTTAMQVSAFGEAGVWERKRANGGGRCARCGDSVADHRPVPSHLGRPWFSPIFHQQGTTARSAPATRTRKHCVAWRRLEWHGTALADGFWSSPAVGAADGCRWRLGLSIPRRDPENHGPGSSPVDQSTRRIGFPRIPLRAIAFGICQGFPGFPRAF